MPLLTFDQAIAHSAQFPKRHLMLGNGFSISCRADIFHYASLYAEADFAAIPEAKKVFELLGTTDFEVAIHALENGAKVLPIYAPNHQNAVAAMLAHAAALKELLVTTIAHNHPDVPRRRFKAPALAPSANAGTLEPKDCSHSTAPVN